MNGLERFPSTATLCVYAADIDECAILSTCPNAKFECKNKPGSVDCFCRYQNTKDTDGCGNEARETLTNQFHCFCVS